MEFLSFNGNLMSSWYLRKLRKSISNEFFNINLFLYLLIFSNITAVAIFLSPLQLKRKNKRKKKQNTKIFNIYYISLRNLLSNKHNMENNIGRL